MSTYLTVQSLTLAYTSTPLFNELTFTLNRGDKIGLIGHNGCGKSSLLKLLAGHNEPSSGHIAKANQCLLSYVEQYLPERLQHISVLDALSESIEGDAAVEHWRAELLLVELGFDEGDWQMPVSNCSGGQQMRLLLARAIINEPDLLLLDEPSNHLDLPSLLWLEDFLIHWKGSFVLVSHDQTMLDSVTNTTWIMRDQSLYHFALPCTQAMQALVDKDEQDAHRHAHEQKEIDRIDKSAKRLAVWGQVYDNEDFARKAKSMQARKDRLKAEQTQLSDGTPWQLKLQGEALKANRLLAIEPFAVQPPNSDKQLFDMPNMQVKSGDRVAVLGSNGCGKSTLLNILYHHYDSYCKTSHLMNNADSQTPSECLDGLQEQITIHNRCKLGYYDQSQNQIDDDKTLVDTLMDFAPITYEQSKIALISAGFEYARHGQTVVSLSGGERARLLFVGLTLAQYHLLLLDEPTNHLDMEGREELIETLNEFDGAVLLVSHDRSLIEQACNRYWFIDNGQLTEYLSVDAVYEGISIANIKSSLKEGKQGVNKTMNSSAQVDYKVGYQVDNQVDNQVISNAIKAITDEDRLLERLLELEGLLADDINRKPKNQKPKLQAQWRAEIAEIEAKIL